MAEQDTNVSQLLSDFVETVSYDKEGDSKPDGKEWWDTEETAADPEDSETDDAQEDATR